MARKNWMQIRMADDEIAKAHAVARAAGVSLSDLVRGWLSQQPLPLIAQSLPARPDAGQHQET